ncbi:hypothetical protein RJT34_13384 [Clitoria ternatea]|uniref:Uncharacterized protein n=1 Tax=Clitoria ternatea TaxID=43366 RepID=A0AAN9PLR7_CLITE
MSSSVAIRKIQYKNPDIVLNLNGIHPYHKFHGRKLFVVVDGKKEDPEDVPYELVELTQPQTMSEKPIILAVEDVVTPPGLVGLTKAIIVVYIALGSELRVNQEDLTELANGIELSGLSFFRALREGLLELPHGFEYRTKGRGVLEETKVGIEVPRNEKDGSFTRDSVANTLRLAIVDEEGSNLRKNAKEMGKVFSSEELHNKYIDDFIAALQKYKNPSTS